MINKMSKLPKCFWCGKEVTKKDYRTIDGITSKIFTCDECSNLSTEYLLKQRNKTIS